MSRKWVDPIDIALHICVMPAAAAAYVVSQPHIERFTSTWHGRNIASKAYPVYFKTCSSLLTLTSSSAYSIIKLTAAFHNVRTR